MPVKIREFLKSQITSIIPGVGGATKYSQNLENKYIMSFRTDPCIQHCIHPEDMPIEARAFGILNLILIFRKRSSWNHDFTPNGRWRLNTPT